METQRRLLLNSARHFLPLVVGSIVIRRGAVIGAADAAAR
jgi:hypothetical protein